MNLNSFYTYLVILSLLSTALYYVLKAVETKRNLSIFHFTARKRFIKELKEASDVAYDLFERRLLKNGVRDAVATFFIGIILFVSIILEAVLVPFNLRIAFENDTLNYYFFAYFIDLLILIILLFLPLIIVLKIQDLNLLRMKESLRNIKEEQLDSKFDKNMNERRQIQFYHYIKNFGYISGPATLGFFIQSIIIGITPYFYYQTNIIIALLPFIVFLFLVVVIILMDRVRIADLYDRESEFLMLLANLPGTHKTLLLKTSSKGIFAGNPKICYIKDIGRKLKVSYEWKKELFVSYINWKDVSDFGLPDVKLFETVEKIIKEEATTIDSKVDNS